MYQSYYALLLLALKARIQQKVPEVLLIEQDWHQLDSGNDLSAISWPCLLIDFTPSDFSNQSDMIQWGDVTLQFRLAFPPVKSPDTVSNQALAFYEIEGKLYTALQGWQPADEAGNPIGQVLTRVQVTTEERTDEIRVRTLLFTTAVEDASAAIAYTIENPELDIEYE